LVRAAEGLIPVLVREKFQPAVLGSCPIVADIINQHMKALFLPGNDTGRLQIQNLRVKLVEKIKGIIGRLHNQCH